MPFRCCRLCVGLGNYTNQRKTTNLDLRIYLNRLRITASYALNAKLAGINTIPASFMSIKLGVLNERQEVSRSRNDCWTNFSFYYLIFFIKTSISLSTSAVVWGIY